MKTLSSMLIAGFLLCAPSVAATSPTDAAWLEQCGVSKADIDVIPKLERAGQLKVRAILIAEDRQCADVKGFIASRAFYLRFTPPPKKSPMPPAGFDADYLTKVELNTVNKITKEIDGTFSGQ